MPKRADDYPAARVALRSASADNFVLIDAASGEVLGTIEAGRAYSTVHEGAVYLHLGRSYLVLELDLGARRALLEPFDGDYFTQTKRESMTYIERLIERRETNGVTLSYGSVVYSEVVLGYQRKALQDHAGDRLRDARPADDRVPDQGALVRARRADRRRAVPARRSCSARCTRSSTGRSRYCR